MCVVLGLVQHSNHKMTSKLTAAQLKRQGQFFSDVLKTLKYTTITREQLKLLHNDFRSKWVQDNPSERCSGLSNLRYHMTLNGLLERTKNSKKFIVVYEGEERDDGVRKKKRRKRAKKVARLAVDQHITIHQKEKEVAAAEDRPSRSLNATQRDAAKLGGKQTGAIQTNAVPPKASPAHTLTYCVGGLVCRDCRITVQTEAEATNHVNSKNHRVQSMLSWFKHNR